MPATKPLSKTQRYRATRRVTVIGGALDLALGVAKIVIGVLAASQALVADGVHSLSDVATDIMVIWAAREASREPDARHPYGHQRIETLASIALGAGLALVALGIAWDAAHSALTGDLSKPGMAALLVAGISVAGKEAIFRYTMRIADRLDSRLLRSNAWHSRSDALSSMVVIIGVAGSMVGYPSWDALAAILVAGMILWVSARMIWGGARELIDTGVQPERAREIETAIKAVPGVQDLHELRTRRMGNEIYLDGHVLVDPRVSVSEGHRVAEAVRHRLRSDFGDITDITIHVDAEDDAAYQRSAHLPLRGEVTALLDEYWHGVPEAGLIRRRTLHYLDGKLHVEVDLPLDAFSTIDQARDAARRLRGAALDDPRIAAVDVWFG